MIPETILIVVILYVVLNATSFILFGADKRRASNNKYRVKESTLLASGLLAPFGALAGMKVFRHKTRKTKFKLIYVFIILHLILIFFVIREFLF